MTHDMCHVTRDMQHMTHDIWIKRLIYIWTIMKKILIFTQELASLWLFFICTFPETSCGTWHPLKLDGEGSVNNRPSTKNLQQFVRKKKKNVTCDTWHMTYDMWYVVGGEHSLKICDLWYYEDLDEKAHWLNELIN